MELEALVLSLVGVLAVAAVAALVWHVRFSWSDELQLAADVWRVYNTGGCVTGAYRLPRVRVLSEGLEFTRFVCWDGTVTSRIELPTDADASVYEGHVVLTICWNGTHLVLRRARP